MANHTLRRYLRAFANGDTALLNDLCASAQVLQHNPLSTYRPQYCEVCGYTASDPRQGARCIATYSIPTGHGESVKLGMWQRDLGHGWHTDYLAVQHDNPLCAGETVVLAACARGSYTGCTCEY